jgi:hypothetical protein
MQNLLNDYFGGELNIDFIRYVVVDKLIILIEDALNFILKFNIIFPSGQDKLLNLINGDQLYLDTVAVLHQAVLALADRL